MIIEIWQPEVSAPEPLRDAMGSRISGEEPAGGGLG